MQAPEFGAGSSRLVAGSRYLALLAIVPLALGSVIPVLYATALLLGGVWAFLSSGSISTTTGKALVVTLFDAVDLMLIGIALYLVAAGLYQLFVRPGALPGPLRVDSIDELKERLLAVLVVFLVVVFTGEVVELSLEGHRIDLLQFAASIALVIVAVSAFLWAHGSQRHRSGGNP